MATNRSNHVCSKNAIRVFVCNDFHNSIRIIVSLGSTVCRHGKLSNLDLNTLMENEKKRKKKRMREKEKEKENERKRERE